MKRWLWISTITLELQKIVILDIDAEAGKRIALGMEKSCGEKKVHFINADVSNHKQVNGKYERQDSQISDVYSNVIIVKLSITILFCVYRINW